MKPQELNHIEPQALQVTAGPESIMAVIARSASDPSVDISKLERMMAMYERMTAKNAETEFNVAMSAAQSEMRPVAADSKNNQTHSEYASYAALDKAVRPIYSKHGFALSFDTGEPAQEMIDVRCYVTHNKGHSRTYHINMPADGKGAKGKDVMTKTHATGAGAQYGMRYLLKLIFNMSVGEDDDGNGAGAGNEKITEDQANIINAKITDNELSMPKFLAWLKGAPIKAGSIPEINAKSYADVIATLDASIKKKVAK